MSYQLNIVEAKVNKKSDIQFFSFSLVYFSRQSNSLLFQSLEQTSNNITSKQFKPHSLHFVLPRNLFNCDVMLQFTLMNKTSRVSLPQLFQVAPNTAATLQLDSYSIDFELQQQQEISTLTFASVQLLKAEWTLPFGLTIRITSDSGVSYSFNNQILVPFRGNQIQLQLCANVQLSLLFIPIFSTQISLNIPFFWQLPVELSCELQLNPEVMTLLSLFQAFKPYDQQLCKELELDQKRSDLLNKEQISLDLFSKTLQGESFKFVANAAKALEKVFLKAKRPLKIVHDDKTQASAEISVLVGTVEVNFKNYDLAATGYFNNSSGFAPKLNQILQKFSACIQDQGALFALMLLHKQDSGAAILGAAGLAAEEQAQDSYQFQLSAGIAVQFDEGRVAAQRLQYFRAEAAEGFFPQSVIGGAAVIRGAAPDPEEFLRQNAALLIQIFQPQLLSGSVRISLREVVEGLLQSPELAFDVEICGVEYAVVVSAGQGIGQFAGLKAKKGGNKANPQGKSAISVEREEFNIYDVVPQLKQRPINSVLSDGLTRLDADTSLINLADKKQVALQKHQMVLQHGDAVQSLRKELRQRQILFEEIKQKKSQLQQQVQRQQRLISQIPDDYVSPEVVAVFQSFLAGQIAGTSLQKIAAEVIAEHPQLEFFDKLLDCFKFYAGKQDAVLSQQSQNKTEMENVMVKQETIIQDMEAQLLQLMQQLQGGAATRSLVQSSVIDSQQVSVYLEQLQ